MKKKYVIYGLVALGLFVLWGSQFGGGGVTGILKRWFGGGEKMSDGAQRIMIAGQ